MNGHELSGATFTINFTPDELIQIEKLMKSTNITLEDAIHELCFRGYTSLKATMEFHD